MWFMNFRLGKLRLNKFRLAYAKLSWIRLGKTKPKWNAKYGILSLLDVIYAYLIVRVNYN
jgi:hypothetical protein